MIKKNIQCSLAGSGTSQGRWRRGLREDDGAVGLGMAWVDGVASLGMAWGAQRCRLGEDDVVAGSGMVPTWSTVSLAQVEEDGSA
jgi:hypothetical protein